jgi:hypothetical protein
MLEGISDAWNSLWRLFSFDTYTGETNVFNNFSKLIKDLRSTVTNIGTEVTKQLFEAGSEAIKSARDSFASAVGIDPSKFDAGNAANKIGGQSGAAQSAMGGMPSMSDFGGGSGSTSLPGQNNAVPMSDKLKQKFEQQRLLKQMNEQRQSVSSGRKDF